MRKINKKGTAYFLLLVMTITSLLTSTATATNYWHNVNGGSNVYPMNGAGGQFSVSWSNCNTFMVGKGWTTGTNNRIVNYNANAFTVTGSAFLTLYGWTRNALIEYYIIDSWGTFRPNGQYRGTVSSDGGTYDMYSTIRYNQPSIEGTATYQQFWSVRQSKRPTGFNVQINFGNHYNAWTNAGMRLGSIHSFQILAVEGHQGSSGYANITVW